MNILFLCTSNLNRSKTAERHFATKEPHIHFRSAGLSKKECQRNGTILCTEEMLVWADLIYVMEAEHIRRIEEYTGTKYLDKILNLHIPDVYQYCDHELIEQLDARRKEMQLEELFARIESPSSHASALRLFQVSEKELAKTFKPDGIYNEQKDTEAPNIHPTNSSLAQDKPDKGSQ
ncbi:hypothetical protein L1D46_17705 [Pseudoalteromonas sp. Isolate3]|uniref:hypothetical protein n=1 Tax=Pseudoalteromonas sp. Isolate3 TaxID=2908526 RepID=UPI001EFC4319|nr:hypothetical protein [Pseudoalteromonas sp. Isolate3]MCG9710627.1 hypothetical protein [Pseudoalteromonas sp. Isolate3]